MDSDNNMCLFVVKLCKMTRISTGEGGVFTNTVEALNPSNVSMPSRQRSSKMQVRRKEVKSNIDVGPLTSYLDDIAPNVATIQIEHAKAMIWWIQTP
mgnify:FL=1